MSNTYTFTLTVQDSVDGSEPMTEEIAMNYIVYAIQEESVVEVLNIVRDYQVGNFGTYLVPMLGIRARVCFRGRQQTRSPSSLIGWGAFFYAYKQKAKPILNASINTKNKYSWSLTS